MKYFLIHITRMPIAVSVLLTAGALALWIPEFLMSSAGDTALLAAQGLAVIAGSLLAEVLYRARCTAHRTGLPVFLYVFTTALLPIARVSWRAQAFVLITILGMFIFQEAGDADEPLQVAFLIALLVCLAALIQRDALWLIPFLWLCTLLSKQGSIRVILCTIIGVCTFILYLCVFRYLSSKVAPGIVLTEFFAPLFTRHWLFADGLLTQMAVITVSMSLAFVVFGIAAILRSSHDYVSARIVMYQIFLLGLVFVIPGSIFRSQEAGLAALLPLTLSAITSIFLLQKESLSRGMALIIYLLLGAVTYSVPLLTRSFIL